MRQRVQEESHNGTALAQAQGAPEVADVTTMAERLQRLTPVVCACVARTLKRGSDLSGIGFEQECRDIVQDVFAELLESDGRVLSRWSPYH